MRQRLTRTLMLAALGILAIAPSAYPFAKGNLTVNVNGMRTQRGQLCLSLFDNSQGFPSQGDRALRARCVTVDQANPGVTFQGLKPGSYAVAAFHDANSDGALNRNGLGIPTEGFGFSGNPVIRTGPPKFGETLVVVAGAARTIQVQLQHF